MSIRRTIILLTVPLFLLLALVNGALLYFQEKAEMSQALSDQALAAAVSTAEFVSSMENPGAELAEPLRARTLQAAADRITGLDGLYLALPGTPPRPLVKAAQPWVLQGLERPAKARALPLDADSAKPRHVVALAPVAGGGFVAARIDAEPMFAQMSAIRHAVALIVLVAGLTAAALSWFVARRITRELERSRQAIAAIAAGEPLPGDQGLTIREARDLADAVRLMESSSKAATERSRRVTLHKDRERTVDTAIAASRGDRFAPVSCTLAGARVAARICGEAAPGSFFALCENGNRGAIVLGRCAGASPQQAFAQALAARDFIEANLFALPEGDCLAAATAAHGLEETRILAWTAAEAPGEARLVILVDARMAENAATYVERNRDAAPAEVLDGIELLLAPTGVLAAVSR